MKYVANFYFNCYLEELDLINKYFKQYTNINKLPKAFEDKVTDLSIVMISESYGNIILETNEELQPMYLAMLRSHFEKLFTEEIAEDINEEEWDIFCYEDEDENGEYCEYVAQFVKKRDSFVFELVD